MTALPARGTLLPTCSVAAEQQEEQMEWTQRTPKIPVRSSRCSSWQTGKETAWCVMATAPMDGQAEQLGGGAEKTCGAAPETLYAIHTVSAGAEQHQLVRREVGRPTTLPDRSPPGCFGSLVVQLAVRRRLWAARTACTSTWTTSPSTRKTLSIVSG